MANQTLKKLKYDNKEVQVESAIRDGSGNTITSTYVPKTRTINSKALSSNITLTASDVGAISSVKTIDTTATTAQTTSSSEAIGGSGTITLHKVSKTGSYNDLLNKPTIPTVNNATLTIQKNGTTVKTFTANASSNVTANITVPTKTSDLTNDSNFAKTNAENTFTQPQTISYTYSSGVSGLLAKTQDGAAWGYVRTSIGDPSNNKYAEFGYDNTGTNQQAYVEFKSGSSTAHTSYFPKKSGTIALTSDIPATGCYPNIDNNFTTGQAIHATDNTPLNLYGNQYNSCCISFWYQSTLLSQFCSDSNGNYYVYKPNVANNYFAMCNTANTYTQPQYIKKIQSTDTGGIVIAGGGDNGFNEGIRIPYAADGYSTILLGCEADGSASGNAGFGMAMQRANWNYYIYYGSTYSGAPTYFPDGGGILYAMRTGSVIFTATNTSPASMYGGSWTSVGTFTSSGGSINIIYGWKRTD